MYERCILFVFSYDMMSRRLTERKEGKSYKFDADGIFCNLCIVAMQNYQFIIYTDM